MAMPIRDVVTTILEVCGAAAIVAGCALMFGPGIALLVAGALLVAAGYLIG